MNSPTNNKNNSNRDKSDIASDILYVIADLNQIQDIVMQWWDRCAELKRLERSRYTFVARIRSRAHQVMEEHSKGEAIPPKKWETLKDENPWLYEKLGRI